MRIYCLRGRLTERFPRLFAIALENSLGYDPWQFYWSVGQEKNRGHICSFIIPQQPDLKYNLKLHEFIGISVLRCSVAPLTYAL
jgi:hypothetical protein